MLVEHDDIQGFPTSGEGQVASNRLRLFQPPGTDLGDENASHSMFTMSKVLARSAPILRSLDSVRGEEDWLMSSRRGGVERSSFGAGLLAVTLHREVVGIGEMA